MLHVFVHYTVVVKCCEEEKVNRDIYKSGMNNGRVNGCASRTLACMQRLELVSWLAFFRSSALLPL